MAARVPIAFFNEQHESAMSGAAGSSSFVNEKLVASLAAVLLPGAQSRGTALRSLLAGRLREVAAALDVSAAAPVPSQGVERALTSSSSVAVFCK